MTRAHMLAKALRLTPMGSQTRSKAPGRVGPRSTDADYPLFAVGGDGAWLHDADTGRKYLDFAGANAAIPLGYGHPRVTKEVHAVLGAPLLSLPHIDEANTSEALTLALPWLEQVRWVKTGSEAVTAAVRIARAKTGMPHVLVARHSYHGWHDWSQAISYEGYRRPHPPWALVDKRGLPHQTKETLSDYEYAAPEGHAASIEEVAARVGRLVAAVVVEPHRFMVDQRDLLIRARRICDGVGAVLIFDEMVYGFRWAKGGASEHFGVQPDLACYGKALGNGFPVACVAGKSDVMCYAEDAMVSGTFGGDRVGLAAARAVLDVHDHYNVIGKLWSHGALFESLLPERVVGQVHFRIAWDSPEQADRVLENCAQAGVLFHRDANNASAAMSEADVRLGAEVLRDAFAREG